MTNTLPVFKLVLIIMYNGNVWCIPLLEAAFPSDYKQGLSHNVSRFLVFVRNDIIFLQSCHFSGPTLY